VPRPSDGAAGFPGDQQRQLERVDRAELTGVLALRRAHPPRSGAAVPLEDPVWTACEVDATAYRKKQMAKARDKTKARDKVRICAHARIVGVVFWDRPHNVSGRAPNSIELHPILGFACFSS
jgi:hypothetical protein